MRILLVGHDFDFSSGDGISRYSHEIYDGLSKYAEVKAISTGRLPRPVRALLRVRVRNSDIVHLMYPDVAKVDKGHAKMVVTWHDLRVFNKYLEQTQYRTKPKLIERFNIANSIVRKWTMANYEATDALLFNSQQTKDELKGYFTTHKRYNSKKQYVVTPLGVDRDFLNTKIWKGKRSDFAYMGSVHQRHKNLAGLLRVFNGIAAESNANLHIFTFSPNASGLLKEEMRHFPNLSYRNVFLHPNVQDKEVARYLSRVVAYLQLSKHEGLGMSILAALAMGTNVLTLKDSVIPKEVRRYTISGGEDELVRKAIELSKAPRPAPQNAIAYARSFTWERTVQETLRVYRRVLGKSAQL